MNRRQVTVAMVAASATLALGQRQPGILAGGWAALELVNPVQVAVVGVPVVIDAQVLQHGIHPNPDFGASMRFTHVESGATETLRLEMLSRAHAIFRGEVTFTKAGAWRMRTADMGVDVEMGAIEAVEAAEGEIVSQLRSSPEVALACGDAVAGDVVETDILESAFADPVLAVETGTTVRWTNTATMPHQVVFVDDAFEASALLHEGDAFSVTFEEPGEYPYFCGPHPDMTGVVEVTASS